MPALPTESLTILHYELTPGAGVPGGVRTFLDRVNAALTYHAEACGARVARLLGEHEGGLIVFEQPGPAVQTAMASWRALRATWGTATYPSITMGLSTEPCSHLALDSVAARARHLSRLGHAGQILLCRETAAQVAGAPEVHLRPLGLHRLRDLTSCMQVVALCMDESELEFPPLRSLDTLPNNLPSQLTRFIGREREMTAVGGLFDQGRLVTLTGLGGCGKTRLALQVAADRLDAYADGARFVDLSALHEADLLPQAVASALGVREEPGVSVPESLVAHLQGQQLLLVLDNCEHQLMASAALVEALLRRCPRLCILATSRERLAVAGECIWPVPPLSLPRPEESTDLTLLVQSEAMRLLLDRVRLSVPAFLLTQQNATALAQLCRRLDGIPLALELAAGRLPFMPVEELVRRLDDRFRLLTGGSRTAPSRQQTLRTAIDWSYDLLPPAERILWRRLSVFAGSFSLLAAEEVCTGGELAGSAVLEALSNLHSKSLVLAEERAGEVRYRLLETIRHYGLERLRDAGEEETLRSKHRQWYEALAQEAHQGLVGGAQDTWGQRLESEYDNLREALAWCRTQPGEADAALRLGAALAPFWDVRGYLAEGRRYLEGSLAITGGTLRTRAQALKAAGNLAWGQSDYAGALAHYEAARSLYETEGDTGGLAAVLNNVAMVLHRQGDLVRARCYMEQSLELDRSRGEDRAVALSLCNLGVLAMEQGENDRARSLYEESLQLFRRLQDVRSIAFVLNNLGALAAQQENLELAHQRIQEALPLLRHLGDRQGQATALTVLSVVAQRRGEFDAAEVLLSEALELNQVVGHRAGVADVQGFLGDVAAHRGDWQQSWAWYCDSLQTYGEADDKRALVQTLERFARLAFKQGDFQRALLLWGVAAQAREQWGFARLPFDGPDREECLAQGRTLLGADAAAQAWEAGRNLAWEQALSLARQHPAARGTGGTPPTAAATTSSIAPTPGAGEPALANLTERQLEVVRLVAQGMTDRQVASRLHISPYTVDKHLRNIFARVGVSSRTGLVRWAMAAGVIGTRSDPGQPVPAARGY